MCCGRTVFACIRVVLVIWLWAMTGVGFYCMGLWPFYKAKCKLPIGNKTVPSPVLMGFGGALAVLGLIGLFALALGTKWSLYTFAWLIGLLAIMQTSYIIRELATLPAKELHMRKNITRIFETALSTDNDTARRITRNIQKGEECCGITNYWWWYREEHRIPEAHHSIFDSCCRKQQFKSTPHCNSRGAYQFGCVDRMVDKLRDEKYLIIFIVLAVIGGECLLITLIMTAGVLEEQKVKPFVVSSYAGE